MRRITQHSHFPELTLIFITFIWGGTFLTVQYALTLSSPMFFVGCRFAAASIAICLLSWKALKNTTWLDILAGSSIGCMIAIGYGAQTIGLQSILSTESAFLTALYVPMVPLFQWIIFKKAPRLMTWIGILCAFIGLVLLTGNHSLNISLNTGQLFTLLSAVAIVFEIIFIGLFANKVNPQRVTIIQLIVASLAAFISMPIVGENHLPTFSWTLFIIIIAIGLASALIQFTMNWAQQFVDPSRATVIYAGEPVWAGIIGRIAGERLSEYAIFGSVLVIIGVLLSELKPSFFKRKKGSHSNHPS
ncbi:DMT family transporter [Acinetobacter pollinis]|uniref:DMT family transporter n=1 Tax=Acinetobacter pollinis TaxID=2605270 RepID=UPI0018C2FF9A|nr:DMT family transporter [Acinetobacter pollinis]MBF7693880.1 DMT family transporter [Acinetobacter pollinis]MBF7701511.1 DMT family transporter [Acinetobacter pollinis]